MTGREVFERAIALIDEISPETGVVDVDTTDDYLARTPYLLSLLQIELIPYLKTRQKHIIQSDGGQKSWIKEDLPDNVYAINDVTIDKGSIYYHEPTYREERNGNVIEFYYHGSFNGQITITYTPIPKKVTDLDEELEIDDVTANLMSYGLAEAFINVEQNEFLQRIFKLKYDEQKMVALRPTPQGTVRIKDVYGGI